MQWHIDQPPASHQHCGGTNIGGETVSFSPPAVENLVNVIKGLFS